MSAKILLVSTSFETESLITASVKKRQGVKTDDESHYPLGIAYLHAYLEQRGHEVKTLFLNNHDFTACFEAVKQEVAAMSPTIVSFQILTANRTSSCRLIEYLHAAYPQIKILIGGIHTTLMYRQLLDKYPFVIAALGEGELTFAELAVKLTAAAVDLKTIKGIAYYDAGTVVVTETRPLIEDLDSLPWPKHEIFFHQNRNLGNLLTTRGCPFGCSFCCLDTISRRRVRKRSVGNVIAEIELMIAKFPQLTKIWIHDDTFFIDNQRVIDFCDQVVANGINKKIAFICSGRFKPLSELLVKKLAAANFIHVMFGLESGNQVILDRAHKAITRQDAIDAYKLFANSPISIYSFLIVGLPGETKETIIDTGLFVQELQKIKYVHYSEGIAILTVYPGTEVYEISKAAGLIDDDYWLTDQSSPLFLVEHSQAELFAFKELLLDYVSCDRIWRPRALLLQWSMLPYILKDKRVVNDLLIAVLKKIHLFYFMRGVFRKLKSLKTVLKS